MPDIPTPAEMEASYQTNVANVRNMCETRIAELMAKHQAESNQWDAEKAKLDEEKATVQAELTATKDAAKAAMDAAKVAETTALKQLDEVLVAAGGIETVTAIIKQRQIAVEEEAERRLLAEAAEKRRKIEELRNG